MINRVLIRIKVVQLLYSYLLTEKLFTLESQPTPPTKEKRFAYRLYIDILVLMTQIAEAIQQRGGHKPLADNRFTRRILSDEKIKTQLTKNRVEPSPVNADSVVTRLAAIIKESAPYKSYLKSESFDMVADLRVWREIFNTIIANDSELNKIYEQLPNYSLRGVDRLRELMETTFVNFSSSQSYVADASKMLNHSMEKATELYYLLLLLPVELTQLQARNLDSARHKYLTTEADLNPNLRFVENRFVERLKEDSKFSEFVEKHKLSWLVTDPVVLNNLLKAVTSSQLYQDYMAAPSTTFDDDCHLWRNLLRYILLPSEELQEALEDKSVFWNDDLDIIGTFVLKTIRRFEENEPDPILPTFKDEEDSRFGRELFNAAVKNKEYYKEIIEQALNKDSWEPDRLAFMDVVISMIALAEILCFPKIPVRVSINEYMEIARVYSTPKSPFFINGLLGAAIANLRNEGKILKP